MQKHLLTRSVFGKKCREQIRAFVWNIITTSLAAVVSVEQNETTNH